MDKVTTFKNMIRRNLKLALEVAFQRHLSTCPSDFQDFLDILGTQKNDFDFLCFLILKSNTNSRPSTSDV